MRCSNGNIHKKPKRATKSHNEQQKAFACFGFLDRINSISKTRKSNEAQQKATNGKWKHAPKTKTSNKKTTKSIFHSYFHSFSPILDLWMVVDIKNNEKPERATTGNEEQQKATKGNKKQQRTSELGKPKRARKNQDKQQKQKTSKWKPGLTDKLSWNNK